MIDIRATGQGIRNLAKERKITAEEIQKRMGFTTRTPIYKWFNGQTLPSLDNLLILSEMLGVTVEEIIIRTEGEKKE